MEKDLKRNLAIGFVIGFFLVIIYGRRAYISGLHGLFLFFFMAVIFGLIGMFFGFLYTKSRRKTKKLLAEEKALKWHQKDMSRKVIIYFYLIIFLVIIIAIVASFVIFS